MLFVTFDLCNQIATDSFLFGKYPISFNSLFSLYFIMNGVMKMANLAYSG